MWMEVTVMMAAELKRHSNTNRFTHVALSFLYNDGHEDESKLGHCLSPFLFLVEIFVCGFIRLANNEAAPSQALASTASFG